MVRSCVVLSVDDGDSDINSDSVCEKGEKSIHAF
jgi:hypothetical protein